MTLYFNNVYLENVSVVAGPYLNKGPLKDKFDEIIDDFYDGEKTYEDCEIKECKKSINILLNKVNKKAEEIDLILSSDLTNQIVVSNIVARDKKIPYLGLYNACASMAEEFIIGSSLIGNGLKNVLCLSSSHTLTSERQFRNPTEYGAPKPEYSTVTVTASASCLLSNKKSNIRVCNGTIGKVVDLGVKDAFDMGSAMAPAAAETLFEHLKETKLTSDYYDLVLTGDLGEYGEKIFKEYLRKKYNLELNNYNDSATLIYKKNDITLAGGSGPACLPTYFYTEIVPKMIKKEIKRVLLLATGALLSTTSVNQKKSIPCICHAISLEVV